MTKKLLRRKEVAQIFSVQPITIDRWTALGILPPPVRLGRRFVGWKTSEIEAVIETSRDEALAQEATK